MSATPTPSSHIRRPAGSDDALLEIRVTGQLHEDAHLRFSAPDDTGKVHASLLLRVHQPLGLPYEAWQYLGTEAVQHIAAGAKAKLLKRGARVTVYARGIRQRTDHGHAVLVLEHITDVIPLHLDRNPADRKAGTTPPPEPATEPDHAH